MLRCQRESAGSIPARSTKGSSFMNNFVFLSNQIIFIFVNKQSEYKLKLKKRKKLQAIEMMGGSCELCGYNKCPDALDFHHCNGEKEFNVGMAIPRWSWEKVVNELKKCIMVCANCHREIHSKSVDNSDLKVIKRHWIDKECPICKSSFSTKKEDQIYCSIQCLSHSNRIVERPNREQLKELIDNNSFVKIGKMYNVSDNAVRKWAKSYNLI